MTVLLRPGLRSTRPPDGPFRLNHASPQAAGLIHWWPTLGGHGNRLPNLVTAHNSGVLGSGNAWVNDPQMGRCLSFSGAATSVIAVGAFLPPTEGTCTFWLKTTAMGATRRRVLGSHDVFETWVAETSKEFPGTLTSNLAQLSSGTCMSDQRVDTNTWYHCLQTWQYPGGLNKMYIDGIEATGTDITDDFPPGAVLSIGVRTGLAYDYFSGSLADIRFYNRVLGPAEAYQLFDPATRWDLYRPIYPGFATSVLAEIPIIARLMAQYRRRRL